MEKLGMTREEIPVITIKTPFSSDTVSNRSSNKKGGLHNSSSIVTSDRRSNEPISKFSKPTLDPSHIRCCPVTHWVPEMTVMSCMAPGCDVSFSLFNRKHRCRICGKIYCSSCCNNDALFPLSLFSNTDDGSGNSAAPSASQRNTTSNKGRNASVNDALNNISSSEYVTLESGLVCVPQKVCNACNYELQLVISTRQENGELRRKSRGELKFFQWALLVNILSYLNLREIAEVSCVSADFYFISKDNLIWYQYNMVRWVKDYEIAPVAPLAKAQLGKKRYKQLIQNGPTGLPSEGESAKRVISLHARYNYTQFLDFARRQEMARSNGFSSFSIGSRILLSSPIKIAIIGPSKIGKTCCIRKFIGEDPRTMIVHPTVGFTRYVKTMKIAGSVSNEITCHIYDISGEPRYESLRQFICRHCHVIGLCYDPHRKVTLVEAADTMVGIEGVLGPQSVVVCGLLRSSGAVDEHNSRRQNRTNDDLYVSAPRSSTNSECGSPKLQSTLSYSSLNGFDVEPKTDVDLDDRQFGAHSAPATPTESHLIVNKNTRKRMMELDLQKQLKEARKGLEVTEQEAADVTARGRGSLQCPALDAAPFFSCLIQCLLDSLALGTMATTSTVKDLSEEISKNGSSTRRPRANRNVAEELLNITMQPSALDIMLEKK